LTTLEQRMAAAPEVESFAHATALPTQGSRAAPYDVEGAAPAPPRNAPTVATVTISADYFRAFGTAVLAGRPFGAQDVPEASSVAIVNERFASLLWPGENALGRRVRLLEGGSPSAWLTVVGVAPNIAQNDATRHGRIRSFTSRTRSSCPSAIGSSRAPGRLRPRPQPPFSVSCAR
jgi:hypothetical protein